MGLKADFDAITADLAGQIKAGMVNLDDPATTVALFKLDSILGLTAFFDKNQKRSEGNLQ